MGNEKAHESVHARKEEPLPRITTEASATVHPASSDAPDSSSTNKSDDSYEDRSALRHGPRPARAGIGYRRSEAYEHRTSNQVVESSNLHGAPMMQSHIRRLLHHVPTTWFFSTTNAWVLRDWVVHCYALWGKLGNGRPGNLLKYKARRLRTLDWKSACRVFDWCGTSLCRTLRAHFVRPNVLPADLSPPGHHLVKMGDPPALLGRQP